MKRLKSGLRIFPEILTETFQELHPYDFVSGVKI